jgi:proline iminopeptidase
MMTADGYITTEDGVRLFLEKSGTGPTTLVILNGFLYLDDFKYLGSQHTLVSVDVRNRGRSDLLSDPSKLERGIHQDVDDLETVRQHLGLSRFHLLAHSYAGMTAMLYALKYPSHVDRIVQIGPIPPDATKQYSPELSNIDATLREFFGKAQELEKQRQSEAPIEFCKKFWSLLRVIYVANSSDADKIKWERCDLQTELNFMKYWLQHLAPSIQGVKLTASDLTAVNSPVLTVHGTKDRSAPYGGARDWATMLPNARLLTIEGAAHAPWIEAPEQVLGPIQTFLAGSWPTAAEKVSPRTGSERL